MAASKVSGNPKAGERIKNELFVICQRWGPGRCSGLSTGPPFLNGEYWELYNLMERKGIDFIRENGVDEIDMLTINHLVAHGDGVIIRCYLIFLKPRTCLP